MAFTCNRICAVAERGGGGGKGREEGGEGGGGRMFKCTEVVRSPRCSHKGKI